METPAADMELLELSNDSYDKEEMAEHSIDTSQWHKIEKLKPSMIKDADLTREFLCGQKEKDDKLKELGFIVKDDIGKGAFGRVCLAFAYDLTRQEVRSLSTRSWPKRQWL